MKGGKDRWQGDPEECCTIQVTDGSGAGVNGWGLGSFEDGAARSS